MHLVTAPSPLASILFRSIFSLAAIFFTGFSGFTTLRPCALLHLQVTRMNLYVFISISNVHLYKDKVQRESKKIKVGKNVITLNVGKVNTVFLQ